MIDARDRLATPTHSSDTSVVLLVGPTVALHVMRKKLRGFRSVLSSITHRKKLIGVILMCGRGYRSLFYLRVYPEWVHLH